MRSSSFYLAAVLVSLTLPLAVGGINDAASAGMEIVPHFIHLHTPTHCDGQTDRQTDGRCNHYMPSFGGIKNKSEVFTASDYQKNCPSKLYVFESYLTGLTIQEDVLTKFYEYWAINLPSFAFKSV
ncbi:hypothetical protein DPMN_121418 [Dreissena polymorpha]|uniref:Uncharacterized protein n=1 Tax=Dreissena polymorpha TaxID=45954 RepID=A0A9D4GLL5_DREPO|nr:hypothetical protein DPMN_121418 [Dreissena polymorpha]